MSRTLRWAGMLLSLFFLCPALAQDKPNPAKPDAKAAKDKMIAAGELAGKIIDFNSDEKRLTLQVTVTFPVVNQEAATRQAELQQGYLAAAQIPDPAERIQRLRELQIAILQNRANLVTIQQEQHDVPLRISEEVQVRILLPPQAFDDKGNPRKYTPEELKKLKGAENLPGYKGDLEEVRTNQIVKVALVRKVLAKPDPLADPPLPEIRIVVIVGEVP